MYDLERFSNIYILYIACHCGRKLLWLQEFAENFHAYGYVIHTSPIPYMHDSMLVMVGSQAAAAMKELETTRCIHHLSNNWTPIIGEQLVQVTQEIIILISTDLDQSLDFVHHFI